MEGTHSVGGPYPAILQDMTDIVEAFSTRYQGPHDGRGKRCPKAHERPYGEAVPPMEPVDSVKENLP